MTRRLLLAALSISLLGLAAWASPDDNNFTRIARLSYIEGPVSLQHASDVDWSAASVNFPLAPGDRIYTGQDGRAEIEFDDGSVCRLAEDTDLEILSLKEELIQLRLLLGLSTLNISSNTNFEINTPAAAFNPMTRGVYRFDVVENGDSDVIVRKGELEAANNEFSQHIESGELLHVSRVGSGSPNLSRYDRRDQWDEWNDRRDADMKAYASRRYLPDTVYVGAAEMDRYGRWLNVGTYGTAWVPLGVDAYWSPYSLGRWCYRPLWGWTWISYEPWGWLPYHYGRWYRSASYGWCWLPGPAFAFNFWSPGLVTFYSGSGWISWCPLGPGDYYNINNYYFNRGIYGHQLNQLRALHTRAPGNLFNRNARGAFRIAQIEHFRNGSFNNSSRNTRWGNIDQPWRQGSLVRDRPNVRPTTASFRAAPDRQAARPRVTNALPAVVRTNPGIDSGNRDRFTRITNPQVPSLRVLRSRNERGANAAETESRSDGRVIQVPRREGTDRGTRSPSGNNQAGRTMDASRWSERSGGAGNAKESSEIREGFSPATRPGSQAPSNQQNPSRWRYERTTPQQKQTPQASPATTPKTEKRSQNSRAAPSSSLGARSNLANPGTARAPVSRSTPRYNALRQSNSSSGRNGGIRSYTAPSSSLNRVQSAPTSRRSTGGLSSGRWSSGGQKAPSGHSSGGGRNRR